jgi:hypothetical protein
MVRTATVPEALASSIQHEINAVDPDQPLSSGGRWRVRRRVCGLDLGGTRRQLSARPPGGQCESHDALRTE